MSTRLSSSGVARSAKSEKPDRMSTTSSRTSMTAHHPTERVLEAPPLDHAAGAVWAARGLAHRVRSQQQPDELAVRGRDRRAGEVVLDQEVGDLLDGHVRPERARPRLHGLLGGQVGVFLELLRAEQAEDDAMWIDDDGGFPARGANAVADVADALR